MLESFATVRTQRTTSSPHPALMRSNSCAQTEVFRFCMPDAACNFPLSRSKAGGESFLSLDKPVAALPCAVGAPFTPLSVPIDFAATIGNCTGVQSEHPCEIKGAQSVDLVGSFRRPSYRRRKLQSPSNRHRDKSCTDNENAYAVLRIVTA